MNKALTELFDKPEPGVGFRQGTVVAWNSTTGENTVSVAGGTLTNIPVLNTGEAIALKAGHTVGLLTFNGSWFILGRITKPNDPNFAAASVAFGGAGSQVFNFALTTSMTTIASSNELVVPDWADEAIVHVTGAATVVNTTGATDSFAFRVGCNGGNGGGAWNQLVSGAIGPNAASSRNRFTSLSGGEILQITGEAQTLTANWAANASNGMFIHAIALYKSNV